MSASRSAAPTGDPVQTLHYCMRQVTTLGASDLHLKAGSPPYLRLNGELTPIPGMYLIGPDEMDMIVRELTRHAPNRLHEFEQAGETDLSYELRSCARFRVNVFRQRGEISIALRVIPDEVPALDTLNLPSVIEQLAMQPRGLVLVTGATGSGKSTTLAAMIDHINEHSARHVVTVEDPIEMVHRDKRSLINQREIGTDTGSFAGALRRALRQDPDVILIGEMRDEETVRAALSAAETGHLVFSTLHTIDVMETIYRVLDFFPAELERQARSMLAGTVKGIVSQRLIRTADGRSRVPAIEVMVGTSRVADAIENPDDTGTIHDAISEGAYYGMQSFDQSLLQLVMDKAVTVEEAMLHASSKQNFALLLEANNIRIDRDLRRTAAGSQQAANDELGFDAMRHGRGSAPVPVPVPQAPAAPAAPVLQPNPAAEAGYEQVGAGAQPVTDFLPAIGGQPATSHVSFPGIEPTAQPGPAATGPNPFAQPQQPQQPMQQPAQAAQDPGAPGGPQQPRPQPGISPDLPGHNAA
ncbi:MAG: PilT/PilU family type 4a pilus ATPase [Thermoleophilia bacterium]|nr:PilT/PilU family type 4a pilus ATPase [Thermoleophilia bacterium]